ncbi:transposase [bacterium]|nr:transposase [bacterium]
MDKQSKTDKQSKEEVVRNLVNNLYWKSCSRDDQSVVRSLYINREIDSIYGLEETGLLDDFFHFLESHNIWPMVEKLNSTEVKRVMVSITQYVVLYMLKVIYGIKHMDSLDELLFSDQAAMRLVGFNAHQVKNGICKRGLWRCKNKDRIGPITPQTLANNLVKIPIRQMENFFNNCIKNLARAEIFPRKLRVIIDATDIETKKDFPGAGSVTRSKKIVDKTGENKTIEITVRGFKLIALFAVGVKIPIAVKVVQIQRHESNFTQALIKKAQENLGHHSKIVELLADRGFLDGKTLWWLHKTMKIRFVLPVKEKMHIKEDARQIAGLGGDEVSFKQRTQIITRGTGSKAYTEEVITEIYGVSGLNTYDAYGPSGHDKDKNKKTFKPNPVNAIVVTKWENHDYGWEKSKVFVTNMDVSKDPLLVLDAYDDRSIIENSLFRQTKQSLNLKHPIKKTKEGMHLHLLFTMSVFALIIAYRQWAEKQYSMIKNGQECGLKRFWKKLKAENRNKVIIFADDVYGIMDVAECMILLNVKVKDFEDMEATKGEILRRYGISPI